MALDQFEVVTLFVPDFDAALAFYRSVFSVEQIYGDAHSAVLDFSGTKINLLAQSEAPELIAPLPVSDHGLRMLMTIKVEDVRAECERLIALGVPIVNGPIDRPWGRRTVSFADPAGHLWELAQEI